MSWTRDSMSYLVPGVRNDAWHQVLICAVILTMLPANDQVGNYHDEAGAHHPTHNAARYCPSTVGPRSFLWTSLGADSCRSCMQSKACFSGSCCWSAFSSIMIGPGESHQAGYGACEWSHGQQLPDVNNLMLPPGKSSHNAQRLHRLHTPRLHA